MNNAAANRPRRLPGGGALGAFLVCLLLAPATPAGGDEDGPPAAGGEPSFTLEGGFTNGVLFRRQGVEVYPASLTPAGPGTTARDYRARIDWGDDSGATAGQLVPAGRGTFLVAGRHAYSSTGRYTVGVTVTGPGGTTATTSGRLEVGDLFAGSREDWEVATFADPGGATAADFAATIDWGDGTPAVAAAVSRAGRGFRVHAAPPYATDGPFTVRVLVTDAAGVRLDRRRTVRVVRPQITLKSRTVKVDPSEPFVDVVVATFTVPNPRATADEYSARIDWGDGTPPDAEAVVVGSGGTFRVLGSHKYSAPGSYDISTLLLQTWH